MDEQTKKSLQRDLVKLGDMIGDGLHHEPGGDWIERDYKRVAKALGLVPQRRSNSAGINKSMATFLAKTPCPSCGGTLKQKRSGSKRAKCQGCQKEFQCSSTKSTKAQEGRKA